MNHIAPLLIGLFVMFAGCAKSLDPQIDFKAPEYVQQMPSKEVEQFSNLGSLYGKGENPLFSDRKAMNINDIVTVLINEKATSSSSSNKKLDKTQSSKFSPASAQFGGTSEAGQKGVNRFNNTLGFGLNTESSSNFAGGGTASRSENFTTTVSARVVKIMQNGNYFIEGRREIMIEDEKQIVQISGVIRPYDITQNNTILSSNISDAKIMYKTEGDISRHSKQGWGSKALGAIWPF